MTRQDIERDYQVVAGRITNPGQFEGEAVYVPYFWEAFLNGMSDRDDGDVIGFDLTLEDKEIFPELKRKRTVRLLQRNDGFVCEC